MKTCVYLISCRDGSGRSYIKIGKTINLYQRIANIRTGCPHKINDVFIVNSHYEEEVLGLERLLHRFLKPINLRGDWYQGNSIFYQCLEQILFKINIGGFTFEEIDALPDCSAGPELEIMLHKHNFEFRRVCFPIRRGLNLNLSSHNIHFSKMIDILAS